MRVGLDIDGVVYPWHYSIYRYFCENKGFGGDEVTFWETRRQEITPYHVSIPLLYLDTTPKPDVLKYVPLIAEVAEIYYITHRHEDLEWATLKFFDIYKLPFKENIIFTKDKVTYARLLRLDYFLDDMPKNVEELRGVTKAFLYKASHNIADREKFPLINNMKEFYEVIKAGKNVV